VKFKDYLRLVADLNGFVPTQRLRWIIRKNDRPTAREEAIVAKVIEAANPRNNITGHYGWGPEEQMVLQQLWINPETTAIDWRDIPTKDATKFYSVEETDSGPLPIPNFIKEPGAVQGDFGKRVSEILGKDIDDSM